MRVGLEVTARLHDAAHRARRDWREGMEAGLDPEAIRMVVRTNLLAAVQDVLALPDPCGEWHGEVKGIKRMCEEPRGHGGKHGGNL